MGFIRIETVSNGGSKFSFEIESEGLFAINCFTDTRIESLDRIYEICVANEILIVRTEDRDFRNGLENVSFVKDNRRENNINAYNWQGNHLWNIGDLVGDIKMPFSGVTYISPEEAEEEFDIKLHNHLGTLFKCIAGGFTFIIDAHNKAMLLKIPGKVR